MKLKVKTRVGVETREIMTKAGYRGFEISYICIFFQIFITKTRDTLEEQHAYWLCAERAKRSMYTCSRGRDQRNVIRVPRRAWQQYRGFIVHFVKISLFFSFVYFSCILFSSLYFLLFWLLLDKLNRLSSSVNSTELLFMCIHGKQYHM